MEVTPTSHTPAHEIIATVAPFRAWRGSQLIIAEGPIGVTKNLSQKTGRGIICNPHSAFNQTS